MAATRRIARDLQLLQESPLPGIAAAPLPQDLQTWHFNLRGARGEHGQLAVHGVLRLPSGYPAQPPELRLCTQVPHPNVWQAAEGFCVCIDMLEPGSAAPYSGWSSSYCIGSVLLQLQSVLFDERAAVFDRVTLRRALDAAAAYTCPCGHRPGCVKPEFPSADDFKASRSKVVARPILPLLQPRGQGSALAGVPAPSPPASAAPLTGAGVPWAAGANTAGEALVASQGPEEEPWREVRRRNANRRRREENEVSQPSAAPALAAGSQVWISWGIRAKKPLDELSAAQLRNARRAQRRAALRAVQECEPVALPLGPAASCSTAEGEQRSDGEEADEEVSTTASLLGGTACSQAPSEASTQEAPSAATLPSEAAKADAAAARRALREQLRAANRSAGVALSLRDARVAADLARQSVDASAAVAPTAPAAPLAVRAAPALARIPHRLLIEVLLLLSPEDAARLSRGGRFCASLGEDGLLWRHLFSRRYPSSELTAESMRDWKHCFLLEVNHIEADLVCFHTKCSFREVVLGVPVDFSMNPRTQRIDYISTTLEFLSAEAFESGLRLSQWNQPFKDWLPVYLSPEHFQRARLSFERAVVRLSPHWRTSRFSPLMVLEVVPKLMNTMVVLLCDKGLEASDRAIEGYFLLWRLLRASVDVYDLQGEVHKRLAAFRDPANRTKGAVPSMGDFLPLLSVSGSPARCWACLAQPVLEETFDRNVLWACRDRPEFARPERNVLRQGADLDRLQATFESTRVSKRLLMFHVRFLELVGQQAVDLFFGRPPQHLRGAFKRSVREILSVERWPDFFAACRRPCPSPAALTDILKQAAKNSLRKRYHTANTDFGRIQASGVSHILKQGETYSVSSSVQSARLELGSDSANILCGACLVYEDLTCAAVVCYDSWSGYRGAVRHSGDTQVDGKSKHVIDVDLGRLPASVTRLFFTLCACGCTDLSGFKNPSIDMQDGEGAPLCTYRIERAGRAPTVVMAAMVRKAGSWQVTALGVPSSVRCCGNYSQVKRDIAGIRL